MQYKGKHEEYIEKAKSWTEAYATEGGEEKEMERVRAEQDKFCAKFTEMGFPLETIQQLAAANNWKEEATMNALLSQC
jgi:hypothetical protein